MSNRTFKYLVGLAVMLGAAAAESTIMPVEHQGLFAPSQAEARIGRPATPLSYAGVARRTTYRAIRRSTVYVATIPTTCVTQTYDGAVVYRCGSTYYQSYGSQYVVVYID